MTLFTRPSVFELFWLPSVDSAQAVCIVYAFTFTHALHDIHSQTLSKCDVFGCGHYLSSKLMGTLLLYRRGKVHVLATNVTQRQENDAH